MAKTPEEGAALIETAIVLPVLLVLMVGMLFFALAVVDDIRLERTVGDAALFEETEARRMIESVEGTMTCWWRGSEVGGCYDDGLAQERTQIIAEGRRWVYPTGVFLPIAQVSRPTRTTTTIGEADE